MPVLRKSGHISLMTFEGPRVFRCLDIVSSNIEWIGWPKDGEPLMVVQFKSGFRYGYLPVSRQQAVAAAYAPSTGKYLHEKIMGIKKVVQLR